MIKDYQKTIVPTSEYAVSSWIYMQSANFDMNNPRYHKTGFISTVYAYAEVDHTHNLGNTQFNFPTDLMYKVQPGVWLSHATNELIIRWNTSSRIPYAGQCCDMTCNKQNDGQRCHQDGEHYICKANTTDNNQS